MQLFAVLSPGAELRSAHLDASTLNRLRPNTDSSWCSPPSPSHPSFGPRPESFASPLMGLQDPPLADAHELPTSSSSSSQSVGVASSESSIDTSQQQSAASSSPPSPSTTPTGSEKRVGTAISDAASSSLDAASASHPAGTIPSSSSEPASTTDTASQFAAFPNVGSLASSIPPSSLRQRKILTLKQTSEAADDQTQALAEQAQSPTSMFGSTPTASYLPINSRQVGSSTSSHLISWIAKHKMFVIFVLVALIVSVQVLLVGPFVMDMDPVKKFKAEGWPAWQPPKWLRPKPESPDSWYPSSTANVSDTLALDTAAELGPDSFPPRLSEVSYIGTPPTQASLYKDTNPHRGELPAYLESLLDRDPVLQPPPWPHKAPSITPEIWTTRVWNDQSKTDAADANHPDKQPQEPDWRKAPWDGWKPPVQELSTAPKALPKALPKVQHAFEDATRHSGRRNDPARDELVARRQKLVRNAFIHAWEGYKKHAWGHDELRPVSKSAQDPFNGWGASIVDALDTLLVMGLPKEYDLARQHVRDIDFRLVGGDRSAYGNADGRIPVFETAIRYLGGFVSAYDLSGDVLMRDRAEELAQLILPAFDTITGVPAGRIRMMETPEHPSRKPLDQSGSVILAEAGSLLLEFTRLWQVTGNRTYFDRVQRTTDWLDRNMTAAGRIETLFPNMIYPERNISYGTISFGGMADSYYEYLIKEHQLLGGRLEQYSRMYSDAIEGAKKLLISRIDTVPGVSLMTIGELSGSRYTAKLEHLACFSGGMLGLGSRIMTERADDIDLAKGITGTCWWSYNSSTTGIGPENLIFYTNDDDDRFELISLPDGTSRRGKPRGNPIVGVRSVHTSYLNRPETIESVFYMWRITGDAVWQERGWQMFASWVTHCMTDAGFSAIYDVNRSPADWSDSMESFTFAETFKYYYLLFSPPELISLDEYVFTTEAHPLLVPKEGQWARAGQGSKRFWEPSAPEESHLPSPTSGIYSGGERGQVGGLTNNQKQMLWTQWQTKNSALKIRDLINGLGGEALKNKLRSLVDRADRATSSGDDAQSATLSGDAESVGSRDPDHAEEYSADRLLASVAGTSVYAAHDGTLEVEFEEGTDAATQEAVMKHLESHYDAMDADSAASLLRSIDAVQEADAEAERKAEMEAYNLARLRSKGVR
ncbi:seven-hairpin glycosidase [Moesziomyces antarcticus]|uniref:alpha-1,2-Mannosidase n=2 Tax=Pseudozyma antarctica TaxID=84753 RepID=A0A081CH73_PSEA2|nr:seven-hairpin glycosidase [Moesziomyces antarcticus]GAK66019.1 seven-hairpin glycosidase [Moesziomyces antarcticus]